MKLQTIYFLVFLSICLRCLSRRPSGARPVTNPKNKQPFAGLSNRVRKMFWNTNIGIGDVGVTMLNWEVCNSIYPKDAI